MKRIAFSGVFDIANYGDHLFPFIFEKWMAAAGEPVETELFSCEAGPQALGTGREVSAISSLAERHREHPFDAIVVSGGALIHHRNILQRQRGEERFTPYPIPLSWVMPSLVGLETGAKVLWNAPGVPTDFAGPERELTALLLEGTDFLSVRNEASAASLREVLPEDRSVVVSPDPAFLLPRYYPAEELAAVRRDMALEDGYAVFHTHPKLPEDMWPEVLETLRQLRDQGLRVVLLPLAYTHGDEQLAARLADMAGREGITALGQGLSLRQMIAVLAGCEMYMGVSFHGAITAFAYGKKVLALDFFRYRKTRSVYSLMGEERHYLTDSACFREAALSLLKEPARPPERLGEVQRQVDAMYEAMLQALRQPSRRQPKPGAALRYAALRQAAIEPQQYSQAYVESLIRYRDETQAAGGQARYSAEYVESLIRYRDAHEAAAKAQYSGDYVESLIRYRDETQQVLAGMEAQAAQLREYAQAQEKQRQAVEAASAERARQTEAYVSQTQERILALESRCEQLTAYGQGQQRYAEEQERLLKAAQEQLREAQGQLGEAKTSVSRLEAEAGQTEKRLRQLERACSRYRREVDAGPFERRRLRQERLRAEAQAELNELEGDM